MAAHPEVRAEAKRLRWVFDWGRWGPRKGGWSHLAPRAAAPFTVALSVRGLCGLKIVDGQTDERPSSEQPRLGRACPKCLGVRDRAR